MPGAEANGDLITVPTSAQMATFTFECAFALGGEYTLRECGRIVCF